MQRLIISIFLLCLGCNLTPIDSDIEEWHQKTHRDIPILRQIIREGDIVFRLSNTQLAGGLIDFSQEIAKATDSDFSHAVLVYEKTPTGIILADITKNGVERRYLIDWYIQRTYNLVIKRLKPQYRYLIPEVLSKAKEAINDDMPYDDKFITEDDRFYCTELVDHCFRSIGHPLAPRIKIKDWPNYNLLILTCCFFGNINVNNEVVIAGNDEIGLFSSDMLETIIDWR